MEVTSLAEERDPLTSCVEAVGHRGCCVLWAVSLVCFRSVLPQSLGISSLLC